MTNIEEFKDTVTRLNDKELADYLIETCKLFNSFSNCWEIRSFYHWLQQDNK